MTPTVITNQEPLLCENCNRALEQIVSTTVSETIAFAICFIGAFVLTAWLIYTITS